MKHSVKTNSRNLFFLLVFFDFVFLRLSQLFVRGNILGTPPLPPLHAANSPCGIRPQFVVTVFGQFAMRGCICIDFFYVEQQFHVISSPPFGSLTFVLETCVNENTFFSFIYTYIYINLHNRLYKTQILYTYLYCMCNRDVVNKAACTNSPWPQTTGLLGVLPLPQRCIRIRILPKIPNDNNTHKTRAWFTEFGVVCLLRFCGDLLSGVGLVMFFTTSPLMNSNLWLLG